MTKRTLWLLAVCAAVLLTVRPTQTQVAPAPILLVVNGASSNQFGPYLADILQAEGVNAFDTADLSTLASAIAGRRLVVLAETGLAPGDVATLTTFVNGGGRLVAMKPDAQLATLLGIVPQAGTTANGYLAIDTGSAIGTGFTATTLPIKGVAAHYTLAGPAVAIATLYSGQSTPTAFPAVVRHGTTATWTYDLARSVAYTRQGDPAFAGLDRDGLAPLRTNDIFYNTIDKDRVSLPHADIQMRLFARVIEDLLADALPLPKLWYFPQAARTLLVVTSDSHANPQSYFDQMVAAFDARNVKSAIYINGGATPSVPSVNAWRANGHEVGLHPNAGGSGQINAAITANQTYFTSGGYGAPSTTTRHHMIEWQGWVDAAKTQAARGLNFDTSFYTWGPAVKYLDGHQAHGYINGSARPMRFVDETGAIVPVWQLVTSLIDEQLMVDTNSENLSTAQALAVSRQLIDASQAGDYAAVMTQFHTDYFGWGDVQAWATGTIDYANSLSIPNRTPQSYVNFTLARAATSVSNLVWTPGTRQLSFVVTIPPGGENQVLALPGQFDNRLLTGVTDNGNPAAVPSQTITGRATSFVSLAAGAHALIATYTTPVPPPEHPPVAVNDSATITEGQTTNIDVLANDSDPDLDPLTVIGATSGAHGSTAINVDNTITYTPTPGHCSTPDAFGYTISDGRGGTASATVTVTVNCVDGSFTHQSLADFGTPVASTGTIVTGSGDGDVRLAGAIGDEYLGVSLDLGRWVAGTWAGGAYAPALSSSVMTLAHPNGAFVRSLNEGPVNTLEFTAQFSAAPWEHIGFAQLEFSSYLIFSTFNNTTNLFARSNVAGAGEQRTDLGPIPSGPHRYRIERQPTSPTQNSISYYIDGVLRATHTVSTVPAMHVYQSHSGGVAPVLSVDRIWAFPSYVASGTYESVPFDAGAVVPWTAATWVATLPPASVLQLRTRTSPDGLAWTAWSSPLTVSGQAITSPPNRFLQYQLTLSSPNAALSPIVDSVSVTYGSGGGGGQPPPTAVNDSASTLSGQPVTIPVLANDSTTVGVLSVVSVTQGAFGSVSINPNGTLVYTPAFGQCGTDTFSYVMTNSVSGSAAADVSVLVSCLRGLLTHTTVADFSAPAIATGTAVTLHGDGDVRLEAAFADDFTAPALNGARWVAGTWTGGAYVPAINGGVMSVADANGAFVRSAQAMPITTFDATLTFTGAAWEHAGWGSLDFCCNYLIFSTAQTSTNLFARSYTPTGEIRTDLGAIPVGSHAYRIERQAIAPGSDQITYLVDGVVRAQHTVATQPAMFAYLSHNSGAALPLAVDRVAVYPDYLANGSFIGKPMDSGVDGSTWTVANWSASLPAGATLQVSTRTSPDGSTWTAWSTPLTATGSTITSPPNRYLQYQLELSTSDVTTGPVLQSIEMRYSHAGSIVQSTAAEFTPQSSGTGAMVTTNGDGDIRLTGQRGDEFAGPTLDGGQWVAGSWTGGAYTPSISGGVISIQGADGAWVRSTTTLPVTNLEATVAFNTAPWQHVGFGSEDFCCTYLIFSTFNTSTNLFARSHTPAGEIRTDLGPIPAGPHSYRIARQAASPTTDLISYVIDGVVVAQHTVATQPAMHAYLSHNAGAVAPLAVDRLWVYPTYVAAGSFTSGPLDSGVDGTTWTQANWSAAPVPGTTLAIVTRTSADGITWSAWSAPMLESGATIASPPNRYLQYRVDMTTADPAFSPVLDSVAMNYVW